MATGGTPEDSGQHQADNVIRFPRDWIGSKDDLIPIGPAADRLEAEAAAAAAAAEPEDPYALSADDFWGSGGLHQPVDVSQDVEEPVTHLRAVVEVETAPEPADIARTRRRLLPHRLSVPRLGMPELAIPRAVLLLAVMVIAGTALFVSGEFKRSPRSISAASGQAPSPVRTAQLLLVQNDRAKLASDSQVSGRSASKSRQIKVHRTSTRHVARRVHRTKSIAHREAEPAAASAGSFASSASADPVVTQPQDTPATEVAPSASENVSEPQQDTSAPASSATESSAVASSAAASGPSGLGGAVGNQCNPKCSR